MSPLAEETPHISLPPVTDKAILVTTACRKAQPDPEGEAAKMHQQVVMSPRTNNLWEGFYSEAGLR